MSWPVLAVFIIFGLSRFLFLAKFPHFYDSPEYLRLSQEKNFLTALQKSHESIHPIYLFLVQTSQRLFNFTCPERSRRVDFITPISFVSAFFGILTFICFYFLVKRLFNKKIAFMSLLPLIFFPHLWLIQTNIMHEAVDHFFLVASILFFDIFLANKKLISFFISLFFVFLAFINFPGNLIWTPIFIGLYFFRKTKRSYDSN